MLCPHCRSETSETDESCGACGMRIAILCPKCRAQTTEMMPTGACQILYECKACQAQLRPNPGDCCVF